MEKKLKKTDFPENTTARDLELSGIIHGSPLHKLITELNCSKSFSTPSPYNVMGYGILCECDDSFLCEHRLQWIVDFI